MLQRWFTFLMFFSFRSSVFCPLGRICDAPICGALGECPERRSGVLCSGVLRFDEMKLGPKTASVKGGVGHENLSDP